MKPRRSRSGQAYIKPSTHTHFPELSTNPIAQTTKETPFHHRSVSLSQVLTEAKDLVSMADKNRNDAESLHSHEEKRKKRMKWAAYIAAFAVFQVAVIAVFVLVVMKVRTPKFRVGTFQIQSLEKNQTSSPSFNTTFDAPIRVKNNNFGPYKYDAAVVNFTYHGSQVGQVTIPKSKANFMSTKKIDQTVTLTSANLTGSISSTLKSDLDSGVLTLKSEATLNGKVEVMLIFKKKKSTTMDCTMKIDVSSQTLKSVTCK